MATPLTTRRFTVDEYHRMAEAGILTAHDRVELLEGQIVPMTPIGIAHAACVNRLNQLFTRLVVRQAVTLGIQNPLVLADDEEPQPDVAVLAYRADGYATRHPGPADTLLVIEVADTSARDDRDRKLPLYARAGIPEAWLVDLADDAIEICRDPGAPRYRQIETLKRGGSVTPLRLAGLTVWVDEVLGPRR